MKIDHKRRTLLIAGGVLLAGALLPAQAAAQLELQQPGTLRVAVYADFPPYSARGKGVDVALGEALAARLGLRAQIVEIPADEDMNDDLRNMVWRGHYLGTRPGDVMLHVPVDANFARRNDKVRIFAPYFVESMAIARNPARVGPIAGSAANAFEVFTREKIGAEVDTHGSDFMLHVLNGRLRDNVVHFRSVQEAVEAMQRDEVAAVIGTMSQIEAAAADAGRFTIDPIRIPEMRVAEWAIGMAVKAEHGELAEALSEAMADIQRSGELTRIFAEHGLTHRLPAGQN